MIALLPQSGQLHRSANGVADEGQSQCASGCFICHPRNSLSKTNGLSLTTCWHILGAILLTAVATALACATPSDGVSYVSHRMGQMRPMRQLRPAFTGSFGLTCRGDATHET